MEVYRYLCISKIKNSEFVSEILRFETLLSILREQDSNLGFGIGNFDRRLVSNTEMAF
jgi:hypothetical protein